jgi:hypothetical protein
MANRSYLRVWTRDFSEETMIAEFARFMTTAPTAEKGGFRQLTIQPVDPTEPPMVEWDLKEGVFNPPEIAALALQNLASDTAYIVDAAWDLWTFDVETLKWSEAPQPLELVCQGPTFDENITSSRTLDSSIYLPDTPAYWHRALRAIRSMVRIIRPKNYSGTGWPARRT